MGWRSVWLCLFTLSFTNVIDVQTRLVRNHVSSICSTWGREHFKTFDGDVYQFPGMCEYNLVSDCYESYQEFSVHMKREEIDGNPTISYVVVTINDLVFHLSRSGVTVNEEPVTMPYYMGGVQLEQNAVYFKLQSKVGITVMWNGEDAVMVEIDQEYANRTCGLCGDFNGVLVYDEFIHNDRKISPIEFGNKHKVHRPNDDCEDPYEEEDESLEAVNVPESCAEFQTACSQMLRSEAWSSCSKLINPEPYIQACAQDMCGCGTSTDDFCICSTLAEFSRQCSHAGGQPPSWRSPQFCAKQCPFNMVYEESGSPCMDTCTHQDTSSLCEDHRMDGCFCPPGTVFDDISKRGCIAQSECQCKHGKIFNSGEIYRKGREECTCYAGRWACESLETPATCAVEENSHVTSFDGKTYTFHGDCYYTLAKVERKDAQSPKFTILAQLAPCAHQDYDTCLKTLKILLNNDRNNVLTFTSDGTVKQNMQTINLPYYSGDISIFHASSFHIMLQTSFGLQIQIQHVPLMQVYVTLEQSYRAKTRGRKVAQLTLSDGVGEHTVKMLLLHINRSQLTLILPTGVPSDPRGLCGNYNMILSDDMKTPQGIVEGTAATFVNSWKANLMCSNREERLDDPCSLSVENERYAKHWCALLLSRNNTFTQCHSMVDPEVYYKRCIYASCTCEKSEACLCAVLSSYARACASMGVILTDWRENVCDKYTKSCPASQTFSYKHQRCQLTCRSLSSEQQTCTSDFVPVDGCSCSEGLYLNDDGVCVPMAKCPCYHNEVYVKSGKSINIKDEHCVCTNGRLHCHSWRLRSSECPSPKVFFNCSAAGTGTLGQQCARACINLDSDCDSTECESGCRCPSGLFDDGKGSCVKESQCPCQHNGHLYAPNTQIPDQCNTCACKSGRWECTEKECPGTCIIYGSGHYNTFDQRTYGFQGHCEYVAIKNNCGNKTEQGHLAIFTENVPCGSTGTTCSKAVRVQLGEREIRLHKGGYTEEDLEHGANIQYKIRRVGLYLVVESTIGLSVIWDRKTTVRILLEPQHRGQICGLCGNFDGDGQNDFTTQSQIVVDNPLEFANSWKVSSHCSDVEANVNPCEVTPSRLPWAKLMCSMIAGRTFQECHKKVDYHPFYENCVRDSCACDTGGDCECFCTAVQAYAQACTEAGVCVAWRTPDICPVFCDYYNNPEDCKWHYNPCHTPCYKTCLNPEGICSNPLPTLEGCYPVCPEDKPIFDEVNQICVEECINSPTTTTTTTTPTPSTTTQEPTTTTTTTTPTPPTTTPTTFTPTSQSSTPCIIIITKCEWSDWYDVHNPTTDGSDWETYENITNSGLKICEHRTAIECQPSDYPDKDFDDFVDETGQVVTCDLDYGLICKKEDQIRPPRKCFDYKIRVLCCVKEEVPCTTTPTPETSTTTTTTTPTPPTTTPEITTTTTTTTPTPPTTTPEITTTTTTTTPTPPTTTPEITTTTTTTTPTPPTTTPEITTTTTTTTPTPPTTTPEITTTTTTTTPTPPTTTPEITTTTTTTTPTPPTTTPEITTTTTTTTPTPPTTTPEITTTTTTTTPTPPTTTPEITTTTTTTTPTPPTTTPEITTTTTTTTPTPPTTTPEITTTTTTTTPTPPTTTPEITTTTTTTTPTPPTTTPEITTTTTTTTPTPPTTTPEITTTTTTTTPTPPTTTPEITTTTTTTTPTPPTTTPEITTTTTTTTPTPPTTTPEITTTTTTTTPTPPTTTPEITTTTTTTTPTPPTTTPEITTTTTTTTPTPPTTTPEITTTTTTTTPTPPTTTPEITTTTTTTTPTPPTTTPEITTTTTTTTPTPPTTTPEITTTTTTTTPTPPTTTPEITTTTTTTTPTPPTTTPEITTTTTTTTPTPPTTTPEITTTTTTTTPTPPTTTPEITTTTTTTTPTPPTTTPEITTTTTTTTPTPPTTTPEITTTTTTTTPTPPTTTPEITTTTTTTTPTPPTTTPEITTTTTTTTPTPPTTTPEITTTTTTTTPTPPTTTPEITTTTTTTTPTPPTTTPEITTTTTTTTPTPPTTTPTPSTTTQEPTTTTTVTTPTPSTTTPTPTTPPVPGCPEWDVVQNETFVLCNCTMARCIENNTIEIIPYECPPLQNITCTNGKKPVLVWDKFGCCQHYACDCECEGWGDPHYITFDGLYYSYQGNCTYILMEEKIPIHKLKIYIDNVYCDPTEDVSCPRSIIVSYGTVVITLLNHNLIGAAELEALQHGKPLKLPYWDPSYTVKVISSGINLILEIPRLKVVITFGITGFSVFLPYQHFGQNTQGHCGTCTNNQTDDCMLPSGKLVENCAVMADYWPATDIHQPNCPPPPVLPTDIPVPPPSLAPCKPDSICDLLLSSVFAACHPFVSPDHFYTGCVFDSCHVSNPVVECTSLQTYAAACAQAGVCLYWRNHTKLCDGKCPSDKVYKPCGPAEQPTCEDTPSDPSMNFTTEGCFCPDGMKLFNKESKICVEKCGCLDPEGIPREFNEKFEYKCQDCICEESTKSVICKPKVCPAPPIANCSGAGFVLVNQTNPSDPCCSAYVCQCQINTCPIIDMNCDVGYKPVIRVPEGKCCPEHTCEPKRVCVHKNAEYQPGSSVPAPVCQDCTCTNEVDPKTGLFKIRCEFQQCDESCDLGYEYVEPGSNECCGTCVQTHCVVSVNSTDHVLAQGEVWSPPEDKCVYYTCIRSSGTLITIRSNVVCPPFDETNCQPDSIQTAANGCCKICVEKDKACKLISMKTRITHNHCQSEQEVDLPYCEGACNTFTMYSQAAATMNHFCSCCKEARFSNRTVDLVCLNGDKVPHTYMYVEQCTCGQKDCTRDAGQPARRKRSVTLL